MHPLVSSYVFMGLLVLASFVHGEFNELAPPAQSYELAPPAVEPIEDDRQNAQNEAEEEVPSRYLPALPSGGSSLSSDSPVDSPPTIANISNPATLHLENGLSGTPDKLPITTSPQQEVKFGDEPAHSTPSPNVANLPYSSSSSSDDDNVSDEPDYDYDNEESGNARHDGDDEDEHSPTECVDHAENCAANVDYCQEQTYKPLMEYYCAKSCSYCPKVRPPLVLITSAGAEVRAQCEDSSPRCSSWNEHRFCSSKFFLPEIKHRFCARTCGLCPDSQPATASLSGTGVPIDTPAVSSVTARRNNGERKIFSWRRGVVPHRAYRHRDHSPRDTVKRVVTTESRRPPANRHIAPVLDGENVKSEKREKNVIGDAANKKESELLAEETTAFSNDAQHAEILPAAATAVVPPPLHATELPNTLSPVPNESENKESLKEGDSQALDTAAAAEKEAAADGEVIKE